MCRCGLRLSDRDGAVMTDVIFVLLVVAVFGVLALVARGVELL
jgi:hypothetical protein